MKPIDGIRARYRLLTGTQRQIVHNVRDALLWIGLGLALLTGVMAGIAGGGFD